MVDPVGIKAGTVVDRRLASVASSEPVAEVAATASAPKPTAGEAEAPQLLSRSMAQSAPVDGERVARIRRAVQEGRFPIYPATIADRLLALRLEWNPHD